MFLLLNFLIENGKLRTLHWNTISKLKQVLICKIKYLATYFNFTIFFGFYICLPETENAYLFFGQQGLVVLLVEGDGRAVHLLVGVAAAIVGSLKNKICF